MAIDVTCPGCGFEGEAPDDSAGASVQCPDCRADIPVPDPNARKSQRIREAPPPREREFEPDEDDRPSRRSKRRRRSASGFECATCGSTAPPERTEQISAVGWIVFAVLLVAVCPFLCWIGLLMKEPVTRCADCGAKM